MEWLEDGGFDEAIAKIKVAQKLYDLSKELDKAAGKEQE